MNNTVTICACALMAVQLLIILLLAVRIAWNGEQTRRDGAGMLETALALLEKQQEAAQVYADRARGEHVAQLHAFSNTLERFCEKVLGDAPLARQHSAERVAAAERQAPRPAMVPMPNLEDDSDSPAMQYMR